MLKQEGKGRTFLILISAWTVLSTLTIALRIWARYSIRAFGADDCLMFAGWTIFLVVITFDYLSINHGIGAPADQVSNYDAEQAKKFFWFSGIAYAIATAFIKSSICVLLMRLTVGTGMRVYKWILGGVITFTCIATTIRVAAYAAHCKPFAAVWDEQGHGRCRPATILIKATWFFSSACILTDWVCAILPIFIVRQLNLPLRTKVQISLNLALGVLASIATSIRMKHIIDYINSHNFLFGLIDIALWSETECFLGIVAGSLATMRPLLRHMHQRFTITETPVNRTKSRLSDPIRLTPLQGTARSGSQNKSCSIKYVEDMGHTVQITSGAARDVESGTSSADGPAAETGSQRGILRLTDSEIIKETQYEVNSERGVGRDSVAS